jgi:guanine deaminase
MSDSTFNPMFMKRAVELAEIGSANGFGGPFGAVIVKNGEIIGEGHNEVTSSNDPTAHAEIVAIRNACKSLKSFQLDDCEIYASCEPCPMCLGAIYWARPATVYFGSTKLDAEAAGFDDAFIYHEINISPDQRKIPMIFKFNQDALNTFRKWKMNPNKLEY